MAVGSRVSMMSCLAPCLENRGMDWHLFQTIISKIVVQQNVLRDGVSCRAKIRQVYSTLLLKKHQVP